MSKGPWRKPETEGTDIPNDPRLQVYKHVYLQNNMDHEYYEKVSGQEYRIPAGGKIKMRRHEAVKVRGNFPGDGVEKNLSIIPIYPTEAEAGIKFVSPVDGAEFDSQEKLDEHHKAIREKLKAK